MSVINDTLGGQLHMRKQLTDPTNDSWRRELTHQMQTCEPNEVFVKFR